ncbi:SHOCT domain-containing protein [Colwelliaceae bacterium 6441]
MKYTFAQSVEITLDIQSQVPSPTELKWQAVTRNPLSEQSFFIHNKQGQIHSLTNSSLSPQALIDLSQHFPAIESLDAITLHPNFHLPKENGYLTLFTAHIEPTNTNIRTLRVSEDDTSEKFETVISEWQFNSKKMQSLQLLQQQPREILRLPISSVDSGVMQLQFNPHTKLWNEDFGQLYFSLKADPNKPQSALYSGVILKVHPAKFGLRSYTVPVKNPFNSHPEIPDEIIAMGINNLHTFYWSKGSNDELILTHATQEQFRMSNLKEGEDRRKPKTSSQYYNISPHQHSNAVLYRGVQFTRYRNQLLYLTKDKQWQLKAVSPKFPHQITELANFNNKQLPLNSTPYLSVDHQDELLILNSSENIILKFSSLSPLADSPENKHQAPNLRTVPAEQSSQLIYWFVFVLMLLAGLAKFHHSKKLQLPKGLLRQQFAKFSIDTKQHFISLFKRHETKISEQLPVNEIADCEIFLNDEGIYNFVTANENSVFSCTKEQQFTYHFDTEKRKKMIDEQERKVTLLFTDQQTHTYPVCVYMRKGNQRLTRGNFDETQQQLIDLLWYLSQVFFPQQTEKRVVKVKVKEIVKKKPVTVKPNNAENNITEQHNNVAKYTEESSADKTTIQQALESNSSEYSASTQPLETLAKNNEDLISDKHTDSKAHQTDMALINALEKLAQLKKQDLLTDEEFKDAKTKILKDLVDDNSVR